MRWSLRFALCTSAFLLILLLLLKNHVQDIWDQYSIGSYLRSKWEITFDHEEVESNRTFPGGPGDKVIIMAKLESEDTGWVTEHLPE